MKTRRWQSRAGLPLLVIAAVSSAQADDLKPYPLAEPGMQRWVIRLPAVAMPEERRVEILVGKTMEVDCNRHRLFAGVRREVVPGWGLPYYVIGALKGPASTQIACPPGFVSRREFVRADADALATLPYNPRLPIVVYAPLQAQLRYRVWSAGKITAVDRPE